MKRLTLTILLAVLMAIPAFAGEFDSLNPPYGTKLKDMEYAKYFVKYEEKNGISYYNYIGPRIPNPLYEISFPHVTYGFVDGKLYSCIYQNQDVPKEKILGQIRSAYGMVPKHTYDEGDWSVFLWYSPDNELDFKLKFNNRTNEMKSAFYYLPLKAKLEK